MEMVVSTLMALSWSVLWKFVESSPVYGSYCITIIIKRNPKFAWEFNIGWKQILYKKPITVGPWITCLGTFF